MDNPDTRANILAMALGSVQSDLERANMQLADFEGHKRRAQERDALVMRQRSLEHRSWTEAHIAASERRLARMVSRYYEER